MKTQKKKQKTPKDAELTEKEIKEIIESVATSKAAKHWKIVYLSMEDIAQEIRMKLWLSIDKFKPERGVRLRTFFSVVAENRIRDIKRALVYKHNKPCFRCPLWDKVASKAGNHDCMKYKDKMKCEKYEAHEKFLKAKMSANNAASLDSTILKDENSGSHESTLDILEHISLNLPSAFHPLFNKLKDVNYDIELLQEEEQKILKKALRDALQGYNIY